MRTVSSLEQLNLPPKYRGFLRHFLDNLAKVESVHKVILFGSCARGEVRERSDVDLMVVTDRVVTQDEEFRIMYDCQPDYEDELYIESDVFVNDVEWYEESKKEYGCLQSVVSKEGVDLSGLI
jgi:predicted nucleotidyltransferase